METLGRGPEGQGFYHGCEPSYEGWKPKRVQDGTVTKGEVVSLPTRDGNPSSLKGRRSSRLVVSLPTRDGNNTGTLEAIQATMVVSLPTRDGNMSLDYCRKCGCAVVSLPTRDGNGFWLRRSTHQSARCEPSYEGWKRDVYDMPFAFSASCEPSYEGWKHFRKEELP